MNVICRHDFIGCHGTAPCHDLKLLAFIIHLGKRQARPPGILLDAGAAEEANPYDKMTAFLTQELQVLR